MSLQDLRRANSRPLLMASLLSANLANLHEEVQIVEQAGLDGLHIDVMDGHFVPRLAFGPDILRSLRPHTLLPLSCHLMVNHPERWLDSFAEAGAQTITIHLEATPHAHSVLCEIRRLKCGAGISLNPGTPVFMIEELLDDIDLVLVMGVDPGRGGQTFLAPTFAKVKKLLEMRGTRDFLIAVDGGIGLAEARDLQKVGADILVIGSGIFAQSDRLAAASRYLGALMPHRDDDLMLTT
jgi:ribulose-phosphate 3-epimerase